MGRADGHGSRALCFPAVIRVLQCRIRHSRAVLVAGRVSDMGNYFLPWFAHLRQAGAVGAFATPFSNYSPLCLYVLILASLFGGMFEAWDLLQTVFSGGHLLLVLSLVRLFRGAGVQRPWAWSALIGLAPSLFANPAIIGQCDAYWAAALTMALAAAMGRRHAAMFAWCGLAVAIKLQAAFLGPLFLTLALSRRAPFQLWLIAPGVYLATLVPAAGAGWPLHDLLTVYFRQAGWSESIALNALNIWMLTQTLRIEVPAWLPSLAAITGCAAFV